MERRRLGALRLGAFNLYTWDPSTETATLACTNLPNKTEGLTYSEGTLFGSHDGQILSIDPTTCTVIVDLDLGLEDIESLELSQ